MASCCLPTPPESTRSNLATGKPAVTADGVIFRNESPTARTTAGTAFAYVGHGVAHGVPRLTLNVVDHIAFGRVGTLTTSHSELPRGPAGDRIVGLDLAPRRAAYVPCPAR